MSRLILQLLLSVCCLLAPLARGVTIFQAANGTYVAWEAEDIFSISNNSPTTWVVTNDATASGSAALYGAGVNATAAPTSFASYLIRFRSPGTYTLYFRWRADKAFTDLDANAATVTIGPTISATWVPM